MERKTFDLLFYYIGIPMDNLGISILLGFSKIYRL